MMKKLYSIYYLFFLFTLTLTGLLMKVEEASAFSFVADPIRGFISVKTDTLKYPGNKLILEDNRKNKPKVFQDAVKTYDERQLLFFTTFGFN